MKASEIRAALKAYYRAPEAAIVFEVAKGTGWAANRHLDAVAMDLWPSRGLALTGIEIKVALADFRKEIADPSKAEEVARFCDYFYIAAPKGLIPTDELPLAWGLLQVGEDGRARIKVKAAKTEAEDFGRPFVAALLRAATRPIDTDTLDAALKSRIEELEAGYEARVKSEATIMAGGSSRAARSWENLEEALGKNPGVFFGDESFIKAVMAVRKSGAVAAWDGITFLHEALAQCLEDVEAALAGMGVEPKKPKRRERRLRI